MALTDENLKHTFQAIYENKSHLNLCLCIFTHLKCVLQKLPRKITRNQISQIVGQISSYLEEVHGKCTLKPASDVLAVSAIALSCWNHAPVKCNSSSHERKKASIFTYQSEFTSLILFKKNMNKNCSRRKCTLHSDYRWIKRCLMQFSRSAE